MAPMRDFLFITYGKKTYNKKEFMKYFYPTTTRESKRFNFFKSSLTLVAGSFSSSLRIGWLSSDISPPPSGLFCPPASLGDRAEGLLDAEAGGGGPGPPLLGEPPGGGGPPLLEEEAAGVGAPAFFGFPFFSWDCWRSFSCSASLKYSCNN